MHLKLFFKRKSGFLFYRNDLHGFLFYQNTFFWPKICRFLFYQNTLCMCVYIYIYAVGGESWPPQGADLVPSTLPAAEPSILARGKTGNLTCRIVGVYRSQIPLVWGPNSLPSRWSRKRPSKQ